MSPAVSPARQAARLWKALGAPRGAASALVSGPDGFDLARAVKEALAPDALTLMHPDSPPPRARFTTTAETLEALAASRPAGFDLIVAVGGIEQGELSEVRARVAALRGLLAPGGALVLGVDTLAAPDAETGFEPLLFPNLARAGDLGETARARAPLPASAWLMLVQAAGLNVEAADGEGAQALPEALMREHGARLAAYDSGELAAGRLVLLARAPGDPS